MYLINNTYIKKTIFTKITLSLCVLLLLLTPAKSNSKYKIFQSEITQIKNSQNFYTEFLAVDTSNRRFVGFTKSDIGVYESGEKKDFSFIPQNLNTNPFNVFFAIPTTSLITETELELLKNTIKNTLKYFGNNVRLGLSVYNEKSYILCPLTENKNEFYQALDKITILGGNSFNSCFSSDQFNLIDNLSGLDTPVIFFFNKGNSEINIENVSERLDQDKIKFFSFDLDQQINNNLWQITKNVSCDYYSNILESDGVNVNLENSLIKTLYKVNGSALNKITWESNLCDIDKVFSFDYKIDNQNLKSDYTIKVSPPSGLEFFNSNEVLFTKVEQGKIYKEILSFKNTSNEDLTIVSIDFSDKQRIKLNDIKIGDLFTPNSEKKIGIEYNAEDTSYYFTKITLKASNCSFLEIFVYAGKSNSKESNKLKLVSPNGGEVFFVGDTINLMWEGVYSKDTVALLHSNSRGTQWDVITHSAIDKKFLWQVPDTQGPNNSIKVVKYSNQDVFQGVNYLKQLFPIRNCTKVDWNFDGSLLATANNDESICLWDPFKEKFLQVIMDEENNVVYDIKWSPIRNLLATSIESNLSGNDVLVFDADENFNLYRLKGNRTKAQSIAWSKNGRFLAAGLQNGDINIWEYGKDTLPYYTQSSYSSKVNKLAFNPVNNWLISGDEVGNIELIDLSNNIKELNLSFSNPVTGMVWSPDGKKVVVSTYSSNFELFQVDTANGEFTWQKVLTFTRQNDTEYFHKVNGVDWGKDGTMIISFADNYVQVWDAITAKLLYTYLGHKQVVKDAKISPQNSIASTEENYIVQNWNINNIPHHPKEIQQDSCDNLFSIYKVKLKIKEVTFDTTCVNKYNQMILQNFIQNLSDVSVQIDSCKIIGKNKEDFYFMGLSKTNIEKSSFANLFIGFLPQSIELDTRKQATLQIFTKGPVFETDITGYSKNTNLSFDKDEIIFPPTSVSSQSTQVLRVTNRSNQNEYITNLNFISLHNTYKVEKFVPNTLIKPNEFVDFKVQFSPTRLGKEGGVMLIHTLTGCTPTQITLGGKGVEGSLKILSTPQFIFNSCSASSVDTFLLVKNTGEGNLAIKEINTLNDIKGEILLPDNFVINNLILKPNEEKKINFTYTSKSLDTSYINFQIYTDSYSGNENKQEVLFKLLKQSSKLIITEANTDFIGLDKNQTQINKFKCVVLTNHELTIPLSVDFQRFTLSNFSHSVLHNFDTLTFDLQFKGLSRDTAFSEELVFNYDCQNSLLLTVDVVVGFENKSVLTYPSSLNFTEINCKINSENGINKYSRSLSLKNLSKKDINIFEVLINQSGAKEGNYFVLEKEYKNIILKPSEQIYIDVHLFVFNSQTLYDTLLIKTDAGNGVQGFIRIPILASIKLIDYSYSLDTLYFSSNNFLDRVTNLVELENTGEKDITLLFPQVLDESFVLDSAESRILPPQQKTKLYFSYQPNNQVSHNVYHYILNGSCNEDRVLKLIGGVEQKNIVQLKLDSIKTQVGKKISIPLTLTNPNNVVLESADTMLVTISYNPRIVWFLNEDNTSVVKQEYKNDRYYLTKKILVKRLNSQGELPEIIDYLTFITALGDTSFTNLKVEDAYFLNSKIQINVSDGIIYLTDIIYTNNNGRYIKSTGTFNINRVYPNPIGNELNVNFSLVENGKTRLDIFDMRGRLIVDLINTELENGEYNYKFDTSFLETDIYLLRLKTETLEKIVKIIKLR